MKIHKKLPKGKTCLICKTDNKGIVFCLTKFNHETNNHRIVYVHNGCLRPIIVETGDELLFFQQWSEQE